MRNTRQISTCFGPLAPSRMQARGGDGVDVRFVPRLQRLVNSPLTTDAA